MTGGIGVNVVAIEFGRAKGEDAGPGRDRVFYHDVQMKLLRHGRVRPAGWLVVCLPEETRLD